MRTTPWTVVAYELQGVYSIMHGAFIVKEVQKELEVMAVAGLTCSQGSEELRQLEDRMGEIYEDVRSMIEDAPAMAAECVRLRELNAALVAEYSGLLDLIKTASECCLTGGSQVAEELCHENAGFKSPALAAAEAASQPREGGLCPHCKKRHLELCRHTPADPWSDDHLACPLCNSTYVLPRTKQEGTT